MLFGGFSFFCVFDSADDQIKHESAHNDKYHVMNQSSDLLLFEVVRTNPFKWKPENESEIWDFVIMQTIETDQTTFENQNAT